VASLAIVVSAVLVLLCGQTDKQTQTDGRRWTLYSRDDSPVTVRNTNLLSI